MGYPKSWLDNIVVSNRSYAFKAELLCEDCGRAAAEELRTKGVEDDGDSDTFPQGPYDGGGEADSACFCGRGRDCLSAVEVENRKIGCPLGNSLTADGIRALQDSIRRNLLAPDKYSRMVGRLLCRVWKDYTETPLLRLPPAAGSSKLLEKHLAYLRNDEKATVSPIVFTDLEHVYGIASKPTKTIVWRITCTDSGGLTDLSTVDLPSSEATERSVESIVTEAASEGAWD